jgi:hypothetical protein
VKDAKLNFARTVLEQLGETYRRNKRELNRAERSLYEWALKTGIKAMMPPPDAKLALAEYDEELAEQRARAEQARKSKSGGVLKTDEQLPAGA